MMSFYCSLGKEGFWPRWIFKRKTRGVTHSDELQSMYQSDKLQVYDEKWKYTVNHDKATV